MTDIASTPTVTPDAAPSGHTSLFDRAIILSLTLTRLGTRRKVSTNAIKVKANSVENHEQEPSSDSSTDTQEAKTDKALLHISKDILDSTELKDIARLDGEIRDFLHRRGLPSPLKHGCYLIPIDLIEHTDAELTGFFARRDDLVNAFLASYHGKIDEAKTRLDTLFNASDYPAIDEVRKTFTASFQYLTIDVPDLLQGISRAMFEREAAKAQQRIAAAEDEIVQVLRLSLKELVDHMVDRLQPSEDGKPKVFRNSLVGNMTEFLETFKARNLINDSELESLVDRAKTILAGVDAQALRNSADTRQYIHSQMQTIKQSLDAMVIATPTRHFAFEDDEAAPLPAAA